MIFKIVDRKISVESEVVLSYSLDYVATFEFDEEWNNKIVTARFVHENGNMVEVVLDSENSCNIPLFPKGVVNVGVYTDEFTSTYAPMRIYTSIKDIGEHEVIPPTADVYQQIINLIEEGRIKGDDGFSPTVDIEDIEGGHKVVITDAEGDKEFDVMDGTDYVLTETDKSEIAEMVPLDGYVRNTDYATTDANSGVLKVNTYYGVSVAPSGSDRGMLRAATKTALQYASALNSLIVGKGTLENVLNERLKEPQFELIEEIALSESAMVERDKEPNGTPYKFKSALIKIEVQSGVSFPNTYISFYKNDYDRVGRVYIFTRTTTAAEECKALCYDVGGIKLSLGFPLSNKSSITTQINAWSDYNLNLAGDITRIKIESALPSGTTIKIYGVRA